MEPNVLAFQYDEITKQAPSSSSDENANVQKQRGDETLITP